MAAKKHQHHPVVESLAKASKGLQFTSETEAGFETFLWEGDKLTKDRLLELAGAEKGTAVEEDTLDRFFRAVPAEDRAKFDKLAKALQDELSGIKVYKVGDEAEKDVYIVGQTKDGHLAGVKTQVVET
jgi:histidine triad (HIT) family protein